MREVVASLAIGPICFSILLHCKRIKQRTKERRVSSDKCDVYKVGVGQFN